MAGMPICILLYGRNTMAHWTVMTTRAPAVLTKKIVTTSSDYSRHRGRAFTLIRVADRTSPLPLQHFAAAFNTSNKLSKHFLYKKCLVT